MGTEKGGPIPIKRNGIVQSYKKDKSGETVITKLQPKTLQDICAYSDLRHDEDMLYYAEKVVGHVSKPKEISLDERIKPLFIKTMEQAGYSCDNRLL